MVFTHPIYRKKEKKFVSTVIISGHNFIAEWRLLNTDFNKQVGAWKHAINMIHKCRNNRLTSIKLNRNTYEKKWAYTNITWKLQIFVLIYYLCDYFIIIYYLIPMNYTFVSIQKITQSPFCFTSVKRILFLKFK